MARLTLETPADVRLLDSGISVGEALAAFNAAYPDAGGIATFLGKVRPDEDVRVLELTHYDPLTLPGMRELADKALIVLVAAAARHRRDAFHAVDFLMDYLKSAAWLWKREKRADGWHWIEPRAQDFADRNRWA